MKKVKTPEDVPNGKHYCVVEFRTVTEDSGWGSENNSQVLCPEYYVSEDENDWKKHINELEAKKTKPYGSVPYVALLVAGKATIETQINIKT